MLVKKLIEENLLSAEAKEFSPGDALFRAGEIADNFYLLEHGAVQMQKPGSLQQSKPLGKGSIIGIHDLLKPDYAQTARVLEPTLAYAIPREKLLGLIQLNPSLRLYFLKLLGRGLAQMQPVYE